MMAAEKYRIGDVVDHVPIVRRLELPLPNKFFILRVTPGRDAKVMAALEQRDIAAWSPRLVRFRDRRTGNDARAPHLGRRIVKPMLPGLIFIPDFDAHRVERMDYVEAWLQLGPRVAELSIEGMSKLVEIEAALNSQGRQRKVALKQLVAITSGQFADFVGKVERLDSGGRLKVFIEALMGGASVIVDEAQVEPVSQRAACATARRSKRKRRMPQGPGT